MSPRQFKYIKGSRRNRLLDSTDNTMPSSETKGHSLLGSETKPLYTEHNISGNHTHELHPVLCTMNVVGGHGECHIEPNSILKANGQSCVDLTNVVGFKIEQAQTNGAHPLAVSLSFGDQPIQTVSRVAYAAEGERMQLQHAIATAAGFTTLPAREVHLQNTLSKENVQMAMRRSAWPQGVKRTDPSTISTSANKETTFIALPEGGEHNATSLEQVLCLKNETNSEFEAKFIELSDGTKHAAMPTSSYTGMQSLLETNMTPVHHLKHGLTVTARSLTAADLGKSCTCTALVTPLARSVLQLDAEEAMTTATEFNASHLVALANGVDAVDQPGAAPVPLSAQSKLAELEEKLAAL